MINRLLLENTLKNLLVFILLVALYGPVKDEILSFSTDSIGYQTIITLSALLIMAFLFANYSLPLGIQTLKCHCKDCSTI
ncbi:hypothetical protein A3C86_04225 [Candidatus Kaiserbacteria bacterium RIFCSPHIGHO2_02_FULL_49_16]|uniref:Uncharacterized protein n=1 Tax=Candidatus Kaiserbacteria bacterium RIFCSPHIGHO2_02_FULL_49_16 TaxID=1798490 RepID=A0A1F6DDM2_9BACT|nr:MAG: hypothetical protein A3C86_04225 [Candidatus Kaiserbacteria bacterium RIFCSPHIGHO2_02_FULL_49_16]